MDASEVEHPQHLNLRASLECQCAEANSELSISNNWNSTLYPKWVNGPTDFEIIVTEQALLDPCSFNNCSLHNGSNIFSKGVYLATYISAPFLRSVKEEGSVVVLLPQDSKGFFPTEQMSFWQPWWTGGGTTGTVVYKKENDDFSRIFDGMALRGFADATWYRMVDGAQTFLLEQFGEYCMLPNDDGSCSVAVRALDTVTQARSKALVFRMKLGKGYLIGAGLNLIQATETCPGPDCGYPHKEKVWVLHNLLKYAGKLLSEGA